LSGSALPIGFGVTPAGAQFHFLNSTSATTILAECDGAQNTINPIAYTSAASAGAGLLAQFARGSKSSKSDVSLGDRLSFYIASGWAGGAFRNTGAIVFFAGANGTVSSSSLPTRLAIFTTPNGAVSRVEHFSVSPDGLTAFFSGAAVASAAT